MDQKIIELPEICVIGKKGLNTRETPVASAMWQQANEHFAQVAGLAMREKDGSYVGFWGAMSDESMSFLPWSDGYTRGYYLAGVQVVHEAEAPEGWEKWVMPARCYFVAKVPPEQYGHVFKGTLASLPQRGLRLSGAVCDYTKPATGENYLFFPVEKAGEKA